MTLLKDQKKRLIFQKNELKFIHYKTLVHDMSLPKALRLIAQVRLSQLQKIAKSRIQTRCILTGRSKAIYKTFKISRIALREMGHQGLILGVSKASW